MLLIRCAVFFYENYITNFAKAHTKEARTIKDWFNRLVARIRQAMDKVKKYVTEYRAISDDVAEVERIRDLFNAALGERNANVNQNNAKETVTKLNKSNVQYSNKNVVKKTKTRYNEYNTQAMIWSNSNKTKIGDIKIMYKPKVGYTLIECTKQDEGFIELITGNYKEIKRLEQLYSKQITGFNGNVDKFGDFKDGHNWNLQFDSVRKSGKSNSEVSNEQSERNTANNSEKLHYDNQGKSVKFSAKNSEGTELTEAQIEYFKNSKVRDDNGNLLIAFNSNQAKYIENQNSTANEDLRYSTKQFKNTLTSGEWKKYNNAMTTGIDAGIRISDTAMLIEGEKGDFNYKLVFYDNTYADYPITAVYGIGDSGYRQDITNFDAKHVSDIINKVEEQNYANKKIIKRVLRDISEGYGIVLRRYGDGNTKSFTVRPKNISNSQNNNEKPNGRGVLTADSRNLKFSVKQPVEEAKDLIAIHNTTEEKLLSALELGSLPSPSIAIMKAENTRSTDDFGNISLNITSNKLSTV